MNPKVRRDISSLGGVARARSLSPSRRSEIARKAALARHRKRAGKKKGASIPQGLVDVEK